MDPRFNDAYDACLDDYVLHNDPRREFLRNLLDLRRVASRVPFTRLQRAIDAGIRRSVAPEGLRIDAQLLLLVNFTELIVKPLTHPAAPRAVPGDLMEMIEQDTATIVRAVLGQAREPRPIAGHEILQALARVYPQLLTVRLELWG